MHYDDIRFVDYEGSFLMAFSRIAREVRTVEEMIGIYCRGRHPAAGGDAGGGRVGEPGLCRECARILDYARQRLRHCPFQDGKTTCVKCPVHCYQPELRQLVEDLADRALLGEVTQLDSEVLLQRLVAALGLALESGVHVLGDIADQNMRHACIMLAAAGHRKESPSRSRISLR